MKHLISQMIVYRSTLDGLYVVNAIDAHAETIEVGRFETEGEAFRYQTRFYHRNFNPASGCCEFTPTYGDRPRGA